MVGNAVPVYPLLIGPDQNQIGVGLHHYSVFLHEV